MKDNIVKVAVIGAGDRGKDRYGAYIEENQHKIKIVAVAEPNPIKREEIGKKHNIPKNMQFETWEDLLSIDRFCDGVLVTTSDDLHYKPVLKALELDYNILLEKPMANNLNEVVEIGEAVKKSKGEILVCHVLRYTTFYSKLKEIITSGKIGDIVSIQHNENIGYYHFAHSFVRGNWRNSIESSPLILAKSCHDMDLLLWLVDSPCRSISSYGSLRYFNSENAFEGAGKRCIIDCKVNKSCPFSAEKLYIPNIGKWPTTIAADIQTQEGVVEALKTGPYGRCVFHCDNDVVDNQVTIMTFENGVTATFNLCAFTNEINRTIKIMGTKGELRGHDVKNEIELGIFGQQSVVIKPEVVKGGHGGGDTGIMDDFVKLLNGEEARALTSAEISVGSHVMSFAAEKARVENKVVDVKAFWDIVR